MDLAIIRPYRESDAAFVFCTWRDSIWYEEHPETEMDPVYKRQQTKKIRDTLAKSKVTVACLKNNEDHIIGYAVLNDLTIEFVYIKLKYRKNHIATHLVKGFNRVVNPMTKIGKSIVETHELTIQ